MPGTPLIITALSELPRRLGRVTSSGVYVPQIDGLRFLAIMPVLIFHAGLRGARISSDPAVNEALLSAWLPMGGLGVSLFFFISGYIISYPFLSNRAPQLSHFYKRRLLRLEPPYIVAMLGCFLVLSLYTPSRAPNFDYTQAPLWQSLVASLTYTHGIIFGQSPKLNPPAWSLEREVQFYLIAPFVMYAYLRVGSERARIVLGAAICLSLLVLGEVIKNELVRENPLRHTLLAESYGFFLGILVCDWSMRVRPFQLSAMRRFDLCLVIGYAGLLMTGVFDPRIEDLSALRPEPAVAAGIANSLVRAGCILLIFVGAARGEIGRRMLSWPWLTLIGGACYSIYLVHLPLMHFGAEIIARLVHLDSLMLSTLLCWMVLIPASIVAGLLFYVLIERPCMRPDWPRELADAFRFRRHRLHSPPLPTSTHRPDPTAAS
ncbi:acyltransferase [Bradyrhizobium sp. INPA01-394B]|uniref:Acyltransferase n=1 Tax=Bradyrhizobium campsiandrae TaxID=1729892 RepID=A0ABR7UBF4_9BRAD|nr:acyltransferase [Bradyrhizobium campsiandrae]MBC9879328.1 acyltransferase [Bradyrhizobium campsiandrae]MBC9980742.1 acyltransferase [Bradyrhizobium campsiandrae]